MGEEMTAYQKWEKSKLEDIDHDTDALIDMVGGKKMGESFDSGMLAGLLSKQGIDPGIVAMLNDKSKDGNWGDGGMLIVLFLILILGFGNGGGFFGRGAQGDVSGVDRTVVNEANYSRMLDAVGGNREVISQLAQTLNCDVNAVHRARRSGQTAGGQSGEHHQRHPELLLQRPPGGRTVSERDPKPALQVLLRYESHHREAGVSDTLRHTGHEVPHPGDGIGSGQPRAGTLQRAESVFGGPFCQIKSREDQREIQALRDKLAEQRDAANTLAILNAIQNRDSISGSYDTSAKTFSGSLS